MLPLLETMLSAGNAAKTTRRTPASPFALDNEHISAYKSVT